MEKEQRLRQYLKEKINPIFERLVVDLLIDTPCDIINYAVTWLQDKGLRISKGENVKKTRGYTHYQMNMRNLGVEDQSSKDKTQRDFILDNQFNSKQSKKPQDSDEDDYDEEDEGYDEEIFEKNKKKATAVRIRTSVSAEAYGTFNKKSAYKPQIIPKTEDQKQRIKQKLEMSFMFSHLEENEKNIVVDAMEEKKFQYGQTIIKQGDDGDVLYLVDSGTLECTRIMKKGEAPQFLKTYKSGDAFGELALLYNAPRAATITASSDATLFSLDRECFTHMLEFLNTIYRSKIQILFQQILLHIVKESSVKRRERFDETVQKIDIFQNLDPYEKSQITEGLRDIQVKKGALIIQEGEKGDKFFMIDKGRFHAIKTIKFGEAPTVVKEYGEGDYFGELSLIRNIPRQASVVAVEDGVLVYLDANIFKQLMGRLLDLLKQNSVKYKDDWIHQQ